MKSRALLLLIVGALPVWACSVSPVLAQHDQQITVVFRYDDYSARSPMAIDAKVIEALRSHGVKGTFAVTPFIRAENGYRPGRENVVPLTKDKITLLRRAQKAGVIEIAQHGYSHANIRTISERHKPNKVRSELLGLSVDKQAREIRAGKLALQKWIGVPVDMFVPPFNTYDENTGRALESLGFRTLSGGTEYYHEIDPDSKLALLPSTTTLMDFSEAVRSARLSGDPEPLIIVLLHPEDFVEINQDTGFATVGDLNKAIGWAAAQPDVRILPLSEAVEEGTTSDGARLQDNARLNLPHRLEPAFLRPSFDHVYLSTQGIGAIESRALTLALLVYLGVMACSLVVFLVSATAINSMGFISFLKVAGPIAFLAFAALVFRDMRIGSNGLTGAAVFVGAFLGVSLAAGRVRSAATALRSREQATGPVGHRMESTDMGRAS